ncbi:MAG: VWA domain-containing protein [Nitrospirae bacterium]|nr:VWA domain-containing protein [Candidatus Manganitrophaceae bacterium]
MSTPSPSATLQNLFESLLDEDEIEEIVDAFSGLAVADQNPALNMGLILSDYSKKSAVAYFRVLAKVLETITCDELGPWVGMGIKISQKTAAAGIRFFKEAPGLFSQISSPLLRQRFIAYGQSLADEDINLAVEYYRNAPLLLKENATSEVSFSEWVDMGRALGRLDYTLAIEYFRITPNLMPHLPMSLMPQWIQVGRNLATEKLLPTLLFMRHSPEVFSIIVSEREKELLLNLCYEVSLQNPLFVVELFTESPSIFRPFAALGLQSILLEKTTILAKYDATLATSLFLNGPNILSLMGDIALKFPEWVDEGISLLKKGVSVQGFFALKGRAGHDAMTRLRGGVSLASVSKTLKLFAEALSGKSVSIKATSKRDKEAEEREAQEHAEGGTEKAQENTAQKADIPFTDGENIYLPPHICYFTDDNLNFEWYKVATAYQAGYLEYDTFYPQMNETADLIQSLQEKYKKRGGFSSLTSFFSLFPEPSLIERLFEIAEGARVEASLRQEYPGLRKAMNRMRVHDLDRRPSLVGLSPRGVVMELLLQISMAGKTKEEIPNPLQKIVFELCEILGAVNDAGSSVAISMQVATKAFDYLYEGEENPDDMSGPMEAFEEEGIRTEGKGEDSGELQASTRGMLDPKKVEETAEIKKQYTDALIEKLKAAGLDLSSDAASAEISKSVEQGEVKLQSLKESDPSDQVEEVVERLQAEQGAAGRAEGKRVFYYDEWHCEEEEYLPRWCRVVESTVAAGENDTVEAILSEYHGMIHSITSAFQLLRPEGFKRIKGSRDGDALDLDALMVARVEMKAGMNPSDRIYIAHQKKERSVAVAFLLDMSGSTQQLLPNREKSILQVEKEALILMSKAVDAIGDQFALYGFSGRGKDTVDFSILKDFDEPYHHRVDQRIGEIESAIQNRDGAAIRHATSKLAAQPCKTRILILISDGKPLDDQYRGSYAISDTKMALREAKYRGIYPYCITVDSKGEDYLKGMYGDVAYMVIDQVETLPMRLPQIYKRLTT